MEIERRQAGVAALSKMVEMMREDKVHSPQAFGSWKKDHLPELEQIFGFQGIEGAPSIGSLFGADFHSTLPLVMFNYTPLAHNTLHVCPEGWTDPLRLCRGIIFDRESCGLVAMPFCKFFNFGEHPETLVAPKGRFEATEKMDGHLGIIFNYHGEFIVTTRGKFCSPTSVMAQKMLDDVVDLQGWEVGEMFPKKLTLLCEIICPQTRVHIDYDFQNFVIIGAYDNMVSRRYSTLQKYGESLGLPVTKFWDGKSIEDLVKLMRDRSVQGHEGFVARFNADLRIKFKYQTYIGLMVAAKLGYPYVMNRLMAGTAETMLSNLPEELYEEAERMCGRLIMIAASKDPLKEKRLRLIDLLPEDKRSDYNKGICRDFAKAFSRE